MPAIVHKFPSGERMPEPNRSDDERDLALIAEAERAGLHVLFDGETAPPQPYVSPYLDRPLRTEAEAREQLKRPRVPKARGLLDMIAAQAGIDVAFRKLIGGGQ